jgi:vacuolar-type H+-ATPase subunit E/Vma4
MMSIENILQKISEDAQAEVNAIIDEIKTKAEEIKDQSHRESLTQSETLLLEEERKGKLEASRIVTQARLQKKLDILSCKKDLIDEVLAKAFQKERLDGSSLTRKVILKDGEREESFDEQKMKDEIRLQLEKYICEILDL